MLTQVHDYLPHQGAKSVGLHISNVNYHQFLHKATSYAFSGENINVMLEFLFASMDNLSIFKVGSTLIKESGMSGFEINSSK